MYNSYPLYLFEVRKVVKFRDRESRVVISKGWEVRMMGN